MGANPLPTRESPLPARADVLGRTVLPRNYGPTPHLQILNHGALHGSWQPPRQQMQGSAYNPVPVPWWFARRYQFRYGGRTAGLHDGIRTGVASAEPASIGIPIRGSMRRVRVCEHSGQSSDGDLHTEALLPLPL